MRFAGLSLAFFLALYSCGPDDKPQQPCKDGPDFDVRISALDGPLPADTRIVLTYGSGTEEFLLAAPAAPEVLFCTVLDADGQPLEAGAPLEPEQEAGAAGAAGTSGDGGPSSMAASVHCELWTQGPATLEVTAEGYPPVVEQLRLQSGKCTVEATIELVRGDAGD